MSSKQIPDVDEIKLFDPTDVSFWQRIKFPLRWLGIATLVIIAFALFQRYELHRFVNSAALQKWIAPLGPWAPVAFIGTFIVAMALIFVPYSMMCVVGMLLFGSAWGTLWSVIGATLGGTVVFLGSRWLGQNLLERKQQDPKWRVLNQRLKKDGFYYLLLVRTLSILPFNLLNVASALTGIKLRDFILASVIGLPPSAFVYGFGAKLLVDPTTPKTTLYIVVGVALIFIVTPLVFRQSRRARQRRRARPVHPAHVSDRES